MGGRGAARGGDPGVAGPRGGPARAGASAVGRDDAPLVPPGTVARLGAGVPRDPPAGAPVARTTTGARDGSRSDRGREARGEHLYKAITNSSAWRGRVPECGAGAYAEP